MSKPSSKERYRVTRILDLRDDLEELKQKRFEIEQEIRQTEEKINEHEIVLRRLRKT